MPDRQSLARILVPILLFHSRGCSCSWPKLNLRMQYMVVQQSLKNGICSSCCMCALCCLSCLYAFLEHREDLERLCESFPLAKHLHRPEGYEMLFAGGTGLPCIASHSAQAEHHTSSLRQVPAAAVMTVHDCEPVAGKQVVHSCIWGPVCELFGCMSHSKRVPCCVASILTRL